MSKASQYAAAVAAVRQSPKFEIVLSGDISDSSYTDRTEVARVTDYGFLKLNDDEISPEQALKLAAWIVETFGE